MGIVDNVQGWIFRVALKKGVARAVMVVVAFLTSAKVSALLQAWGVTLDPAALELSLTAALMGALEMARNFIKFKTKTKALG